MRAAGRIRSSRVFVAFLISLSDRAINGTNGAGYGLVEKVDEQSGAGTLGFCVSRLCWLRGCFCLVGVSGEFSRSGLGMGLEGFPGTPAFHENPHMKAVRLKIASLACENGLILCFEDDSNH